MLFFRGFVALNLSFATSNRLFARWRIWESSLARNFSLETHLGAEDKKKLEEVDRCTYTAEDNEAHRDKSRNPWPQIFTLQLFLVRVLPFQSISQNTK